jgi:HEAT repeat protein
METIVKEKLLQEVRAKGIEIDTIDDLMKIDNNYKDLIPLLIRYMQDVEDEEDKQFLARCLGVKGFNEAVQPLIQEFYKMKNVHKKWALGNSLSIIKDKNSLPDLLKIVQEKEHGMARGMIVYELGCASFRGEGVKDILIGLLDDEDVYAHAIYALGNMRDPELIRHIEPFLNHSNSSVRKSAKRAIEKLSKPPRARGGVNGQ